jgi:DNA polymerase III alpha subunit
MFPQLRVRTGYTFREVYGRMPEIIDRLKEIGCAQAACVDVSTWGHVRWEQACEKAEIIPMFGMDIPILPDFMPEKGELLFKPKAWVLAQDTGLFYNTTSKCVQNQGLTAKELGDARGVIRFVGGAVGHAQARPAAFDYIDVNPASYVAIREAVQLHLRTGIPLALTGYNSMPRPEHENYAHAWEVRESVGLHHIATVDEMWDAMRLVMPRHLFSSALENSREIAECLKDVRLKKAPLIEVPGDIAAACREGQKYRLEKGHIAEWTQVYEERLVEEIKQIQMKNFDSYFTVVADMVRFAKTKMLVGPARGSAAGSLVCYLMGITEVDPIPHKLLFQRFIDISRNDLPDIDIDFCDTKRHLVFEYLADKYGAQCVAKLGNINTLKAASVMAQVGKKFDIPISETNGIRQALIEYSSGDARYGKGLEDTMAMTDPGQSFARRFPEASKCMADLEIHPSHTGVHAAGILVCNFPVTDYCTVNAEGVAQLDKPDSEYLNLLKIDALGLRTLGIIEDSGVVTADELYSLKLDDPEVLQVLNDDKMTGVFQFEGNAVRSVTHMVTVKSFSMIDNITALARPGPLASGMWKQYVECSNGAEVTYEMPQLEKYLGETFGVFLYQEQIMSVVKEIGLFDWIKTSAVRKAMSGRKGEEYFNKMGEDFIKGATSQGIPEGDALKLWKAMVTFGSWGFNKSHSVSYAIVTYWTCWLKRYHPVEFAAACLRSAKDDDQTIAILRELAKEGVKYVAIDPEHSEMNWRAVNGALVGGIVNAKGYGPVKALKYIEMREAFKNGAQTEKEIKKWEKAKESLIKAEVLYKDLNEAHTIFGAYYDNPRLAGVMSGHIANIKEVKDREEAVMIGKLTKKVLADENEAIRIKKRGGAIKKGKTQFLDLFCVDDSIDTAWRFRIRPDLYLEFGKSIMETVPINTWFLIRGWKISGIDMFIVKKIKILEKPKMEDQNG